MIPTIRIEEPRFSEVAERAVESEIGDGMRLAQACFLEEILGAVFGSITLWYLVSSNASLS
ncbi:hypothetical protein [Candidatus Binatus sp.]|uniref:hypothetical protein n=1 Tax=Candidatus Binatus sp. TaxID=2811406 RepID=UPI003CC5FDCD